MKRRRRKIKRPQPAWKSAIGFSVGVHAIVVLCLAGFGWRYLTQSAPGTKVTIHEVMLGESKAGRDVAPPQLMKPHAPPQRIVEGHAQSSPEDGTGVSSSASSGSGGSTGPGSGTAGDPTLAEIRRRIEQAKRYPAQARERHIEGKVGVRFSIQTNGEVQDIEVTQSSGARILDDAAVTAIRNSSPLPYYRNTIDLSLAFWLR